MLCRGRCTAIYIKYLMTWCELPAAFQQEVEISGFLERFFSCLLPHDHPWSSPDSSTRGFVEDGRSKVLAATPTLCPPARFTKPARVFAQPAPQRPLLRPPQEGGRRAGSGLQIGA